MSIEKILKYFNHSGRDGEGQICEGTKNYHDPLYLIKCIKCKNYDITFAQWENDCNKCDICKKFYCRECKEKSNIWCDDAEKCVCEKCVCDICHINHKTQLS